MRNKGRKFMKRRGSTLKTITVDGEFTVRPGRGFMIAGKSAEQAGRPA